MFDQILIFIFNTVLGLLSLALLLRFYMQLISMPYRNPVSHFLVALTDFIVRPTSRFIPGLKGINLSALLLAWLTQFILIAGIYKLQANSFSADIGTITMALMLLAFVEIIKTTFNIEYLVFYSFIDSLEKVLRRSLCIAFFSLSYSFFGNLFLSRA